MFNSLSGIARRALSRRAGLPGRPSTRRAAGRRRGTGAHAAAPVPPPSPRSGAWSLGVPSRYFQPRPKWPLCFSSLDNLRMCSITYTFFRPRNRSDRVYRGLRHSCANTAANWLLQIPADIRCGRLRIGSELSLLTCPRSNAAWNRLQVKPP